jgi:hypothetical protein
MKIAIRFATADLPLKVLVLRIITITSEIQHINRKYIALKRNFSHLMENSLSDLISRNSGWGHQQTVFGAGRQVQGVHALQRVCIATRTRRE